MRRLCQVALAISLVIELAVAQDRAFKPPDTVRLDGVPKIPLSFRDVVQRYTTASSDSPVGWNPLKIEPIFIRRYSVGYG